MAKRLPPKPKNSKRIMYETEEGTMDYKDVTYRSLATERGQREAYDKWVRTYSRQRQKEQEILGFSRINPAREAYMKVTGRHTAVEERRVALYGLSKGEYLIKYDSSVNDSKIGAVMKEVNELVKMSLEKYPDYETPADTSDPLWLVRENLGTYVDVQRAYVDYLEGIIDSKQFWTAYHELNKTPHEIVRKRIYGDS